MTRDQKIENIFKSGQYESVTWDGGLWLGLRVKKKKGVSIEDVLGRKTKEAGSMGAKEAGRYTAEYKVVLPG